MSFNLLGSVIDPIQITDDIANDIATALGVTDEEAERRFVCDLRQLDQRRRTVAAKLDRGWTRTSSPPVNSCFSLIWS